MKLVTWDVDGTLYSLPELKRRVFLKLFPRGKWRLLRSMMALHDWIDAERVLADGKVNHAQWQSQWGEVFTQEKKVFSEVLAQMKPRADALKLLEDYRSSGIVQVALSDLESRYKIKILGLESYFVEVVSAFEVGYWKPSPVAFQKIQRRFGVEAHEHLHIGDRWESDGAGAKASGCRFQYFGPTP